MLQRTGPGHGNHLAQSAFKGKILGMTQRKKGSFLPRDTLFWQKMSEKVGLVTTTIYRCIWSGCALSVVSIGVATHFGDTF